MPSTTKKLKLFCLLFALSVIASCGKKNESPETPFFQSPQGIYVGVDVRSAPFGTTTLWKNDATHTLGEGHAVDIALSGSDLYTLAMTDNEIFYWKNDTRTSLQLPSAAASGTYVKHIAVAGNDVYVIGYYYDKTSTQVPVYWKNGVVVETKGSSFWAITASGNDIYMLGYIGGKIGYTKNGVVTYVENFQAAGIAVSGSDVYLYGNVLPAAFNPVRGVWKNGVVTNIGTEIQLDAIYVKGTDVYLAGIDYHTGGAYWKNGVTTRFAPNGDTGGISGMYVDNSNNVYISGQMIKDGKTSIACYWKNGTRVDLSIKSSSAKGVVGIE